MQKEKYKIKSIKVSVMEYFDKTYGNSYFSATAVINFENKNQKIYKIPFQYGCGDHYQTVVFEKIKKEMGVKCDDYTSMGRYCDDNKIVLITEKQFVSKTK